MKKIILIYLSILILTVSLVSCASSEYDPLEGKNIIDSNIKTGALASLIYDASTFEAVNELSTQIIRCKVTGINYLETAVFGTISFKLDVEVEEIYLDIGEGLSVGDSIIVSTNNALIKANEMLEVLPINDARNYNILQDGPYAENDYALYSAFDGTPMEIGGSYIVYLTDMFLESENVYADIGYSHVYAITESGIYQGADITKLDMNERELLKMVKSGVKERSGRLEEVGRKQLISELSKKQAEEREELAKETDSME